MPWATTTSPKVSAASLNCSAVAEPQSIPYGAWPSPIAAGDLVAGAAGLAEVITDGSAVWFTESRPEEAGRVALMRWQASGDGAGTIEEMTPPDASVRTRVHEYGGGAWFVADGTVWFTDDSDQRLRRLDDGQVQFLTSAPDIERGVRYADGRPTPDKAWYVCVRETHLPDEDGAHVEPINDLVAVAGDGSERIEVIASGADFYSSPRLNADGTEIVWVQWNHPNMSWDATELWHARCADGVVTDAKKIAGDGATSIVLPGFAADGSILAVADRDEWWNLFRFDRDGGEPEPVIEGSFEIATPGWVFGISRWVETSNGLVVGATDPGGDTLVDAASGEVRDDWSAVSALAPLGDGVVFIGARHDEEPSIVQWTPGSEPSVLRGPRDLGYADGFFPDPAHIVFPTSDGEEAHGWYYAPANPDAAAASDELPPVLVLAHGGPTGRARSELQLSLRYWTSRGFAVVDVDYRGSTGYGRTYRRALDNRWGIADVEDAIAAVHYLSDAGLVDPDRALIKGGSAGGLTVLGALADSDVFAAGASRYGVADLKALAEDTHKFEARYCDRLIAPWPEGLEIYEARSPINRVEDLATPMIVLQGDADPVVPPNQSEAVVAALADQGIPHAYLLFPGVAHGFRDAETIVTALEAELSFFCQILGIEPAGDIPTIDIAHSDVSTSGGAAE
jgi:dipeptidyl aminopeptidase/acylaminoacyl peptidase